MKGALNADRKTIFQYPQPPEQQIRNLLNGQVTKVRIDDFYEVIAHGKHLILRSTAPGAMENEQLGLFSSSVQALYRFFASLYRAQNPEFQVMQNECVAEQFVDELKTLPTSDQRRAVKISDKPGRSPAS